MADRELAPWQRIEYGRMNVHPTTGRYVCAVCLIAFHQLGVHVRKSHRLSEQEYRQRFGLAPATSLTSRTVRERHRRGARESPLTARVVTAPLRLPPQHILVLDDEVCHC
jgi:hypothetical protein